MSIFSSQLFLILISFYLSYYSVYGSTFFDFDSPSSYDKDDCLIFHFGTQEDDRAMRTCIINAPIEKVVSAFIDCPEQMCDIYSLKCLRKGAQKIVKKINNTGLMEKFYQSLRFNESASPLVSINQEITRQSIYVESFIHNVPEALYFEFLRLNYIYYHRALIAKSMSCKTPESKVDILNRLKDEIAIINAPNSNIPWNRRILCLETLPIVAKFVNNEPIELSQIVLQPIHTFIFISIGFNRYDIAEQVVRTFHHDSISFQIISEFYSGSFSSYIEDFGRSIEFFKGLMRSEEEKALLDKIIKEN